MARRPGVGARARRVAAAARRLGAQLVPAALAAALALALWPWGAPAQPATFPEGIAAGDATHDAAILWARLPSGGDVAFEVATAPNFSDARRTAAERAAPAHDFVVKIDATALQPGTRYFYRSVVASGRGPAGTFTTAPAADHETPFRLTWGADSHEAFRPFRAFDAMRAREPDAFLYLGDTVYADQGRPRATSLVEYREKYRANRRDEALRALLASTASWLMWDDHEVENNFDRDHPRLAVGRQAFLEHWPIRAAPDEPERLYRWFRWGRLVDVFLLDTRQYRAPQTAPDGPSKTMLGARQKAWLLEGLSRSTALVKVVASSVPLRYASDDAWPGYARERDEILALVRDQRIRNVLFLSGDVHYAAWIRHPEGVHEAIAGPLGAFTASRAPAAGQPGVMWTIARRVNFGELRVTLDEIELTWRDAEGAVLHTASVAVLR